MFNEPPDTCRSGKSEAYYVTARTARAEEANSYASMSDLVRQIRAEAGLTDTPRAASQGPVVSEMRIGKGTKSTDAVL